MERILRNRQTDRQTDRMASLDEFNELKKQVVALQKELSRVSDEAEVRKIHHKYGYYLDKCLYNEVNTFFSSSSHSPPPDKN